VTYKQIRTEFVRAFISFQLTNALFPNYKYLLLITKKPTVTQGLLPRIYTYRRPITMQLQLPKVYDHVTRTYRKSISIKTTPTEDLLPCNYSYPMSMTMLPTPTGSLFL
jgi:hypothetical protein